MVERIILASRAIDKGERYHNAGEGVPVEDDMQGRVSQAMGSKLYAPVAKRAAFPYEVLVNDGSYYSYDSMSFGGSGTHNFLSRDVQKH